MFRRYWGVLVVGLALGFVLGVLLFVLVLAPDLGGGRGQARLALSYGVSGLILAGAACAGGWAAVAMYDRRLERAPRRRVLVAAGGAAAGTGAVGVVAAALGGGLGQGAPYIVLGITAVLAVLAAIVAAALIVWAEKPRRADRVKKLPLVRASRWTTF